jgi:hypothetical protein
LKTYPYEIFYLFILTVCISLLANSQNQNIIIDNSFPYNVNQQTLGATIGGDTIFILLQNQSFKISKYKWRFSKPLVIINKGQVKISSPNSYSWGAITFEN